MNDLLDRLRAANPVDAADVAGDVEPLQRHETSPRHQGRLLAAAATVCILAICAALVGFNGSATPGGNLAEAAIRAVSPGSGILHIQTSSTQAGDGAREGVATTDLWLAADGKGRARLTAADGTVLVDQVQQAVGADSGQPDPLALAREQIKDGGLTPGGEVELNGKRAERFTYRDHPGSELFVDPTTSKPVRIVSLVRTPTSSLTVTDDFTLIEQLPDSAENRRLLVPPSEPSALP